MLSKFCSHALAQNSLDLGKNGNIIFAIAVFFIEITAVRLHTDHGFQPPEAVHCIQSGKSKHTAAISTGGSTGTLHHHCPHISQGTNSIQYAI